MPLRALFTPQPPTRHFVPGGIPAGFHLAGNIVKNPVGAGPDRSIGIVKNQRKTPVPSGTLLHERGGDTAVTGIPDGMVPFAGNASDEDQRSAWSAGEVSVRCTWREERDGEMVRRRRS